MLQEELFSVAFWRIHSVSSRVLTPYCPHSAFEGALTFVEHSNSV